MRQGASGHVRLVQCGRRTLVEKRLPDPLGHDTEALALRTLAGSGLHVPELVEVAPGSILMTRMPGERLDEVHPDVRLDGLRASAALLRRLHGIEPPAELPAAPDDARTIRRYVDAGGPPLPLTIPPATPAVFCHGDWGDGNLLAVDGRITAVLDWEKAHLGDPLRELAGAAWGAARKDPRSFDAIAEGYGADPDALRPWVPIHAARLWLWFAEMGPPEHLDQLTAELLAWHDA
ncbi:phosphotransferase family protein [Agrococcus citreus]|uniref:Aminoglycoside phosphotransferase domain-containing protein n=1 Tax=Agrococcus citreus TaxID=84643 RepID=A0ABP4JGK5_9MICO